MTLAEQWWNEGYQKGIQNGIQNGMFEAIEVALTLRFGNAGLKNMERIRGIRDLEKLKAIKNLAMIADNVSDFEKNIQ